MKLRQFGVRYWVPAVLISSLIIGVSACAGGQTFAVQDTETVEADSTTAAQSSVQGAASAMLAVEQFLNDLEEGSSQAGDLVSADQLGMLIGVEDPTGVLMAKLLTDGIDTTVATNFWEAFATSFEPFAGGDLQGWRLGDTRAVITNGTTFVFVGIEHELGESEMVVVDTGSGWQVDLLASFGHTFAPVFNHWLEGAPGEASIWEPAFARQATSVGMAIDRTDSDSIYQQDLAELMDRLSLLQP